MITCPKCGQRQVFEERYIPLPSGKLRGWKRVLGSVIKALFIGFQVFMVLAILAAMLVSVMTTDPESEMGSVIQDWFRRSLGFVPPVVLFNPCTIILLSAFFLVAFQFGTTLAVGWVSELSAALCLKRRPLRDWPRVYVRTCSNCGDHRVWNPKAERFIRDSDKPGYHSCPFCGRVVNREHEVVSRSCPHCGTILPVPKAVRRERQFQRLRAYHPYLQTLQECWEGTYKHQLNPIPEESDQLTVIFNTYRRSLGEDLGVEPGYQPAGYLRKTLLKDPEIHLFTSAYSHLLRGEMETASSLLRKLTETNPDFPEPWIWLSAFEDVPRERKTLIEKAVELDPAHPLAVDALTLLEGEDLRIGTEGHIQEAAFTLVRCPRCGGRLTDNPLGSGVVCAYCGTFVEFNATEIREAPLVSTLRLQRKDEEGRWGGMEPVWRCQGCGAEMIMTQRLAENCLYCGSLNLRSGRELSPTESPQALLPFEISKAGAEELVRAALMADPELRAHTKDALQRGVEMLEALYIPFWRFDGEVERRWLVGKSPQGVFKGREKRMFFEGVHLAAVITPPPSLLDGLFPFPLRRAVAFEPERLADHPAQLHDLDVTLAVEDAYDIMLWMAQWKEGVAVTTTEDGQGAAYRVFQVSQTTYQLVLVPVWVAWVRWDRILRLVLVNGATGRATIGSTNIFDLEQVSEKDVG